MLAGISYPKKSIKTIWNYVYFYYTFVFFALTMFVLFPVIALAINWFGQKRGGQILTYALKIWAVSFAIPSGIVYRRLGHQITDKPCVYICNHSSFLDTPALVWAIKRPFRILGKSEMSAFPVFGYLYKKIVVVLDRRSVAARASAFKTMLTMLDSGASVLIFPEGTMSRQSDTLLPFQNGAFALAIQAKVPVYVLGSVGAAQVLPPVWPPKLSAGTVQIRFGPVLDTQELTMQDLNELRQTARHHMLELLGYQTNETSLKENV